MPRKRNRERKSESEGKGDRRVRGPFPVLLVLMAALLLTVACLLAWNACERFETVGRPMPPLDTREPATGDVESHAARSIQHFRVFISPPIPIQSGLSGIRVGSMQVHLY